VAGRGAHGLFKNVSRFNDFLEIRGKCLISMGFEAHPDFLWITLLKTGAGWAESLENQAFHRNAHRMSRKLSFNEINNLRNSCPFVGVAVRPVSR
jgi:hypothetical protein